MPDYKALLQQAIYDYEAKAGAFLMTGREVSDMQKRAQAYFNVSNPLVSSRAIAVSDKAFGLLTEFNSIQVQAVEVGKKAVELRAKMDSNKEWKAIFSADWNSFGWETLQAARLIAGEVSGATSDLFTINRRMSAYMTNVTNLRSDVSQLDDYAQGKGVSAKVDALAGFSGSTVKTVAVIGVLGLIAAYVLPQGIMRARRA